MVQRFTCPSDSIPAKVSSKTTKGDASDLRGSMGWNETATPFPLEKKQHNMSISSSSSGDGNNRTSTYRHSFAKKELNEKEQRVMEQKELKKMIESVKDLAATTYEGMERKNYLNKKSGTAPIKAQKMPFKMRIGIKEGREKRLAKAINSARESGVVLPTSTVNKLKSSHGSGKEPKRMSHEHSNPKGLDGLRSTNGVFRLSKKRLPQKLMRNQK